MTVVDIVQRLFTAKGVTAERVKKARGLAQRCALDWAEVLAQMTPEQRALVDAA